MNAHAQEIVRYGINGVAATAVHYGVLTFNLKVIEVPSAGLSNLIAAIFGIGASFLGSRYFVFAAMGESIIRQAIKFSGLYGVIAVLHGLVLLVWTDCYGFDYRLGFLIATAIQVSLSYMGNKFLVFRTL
jgi:putative flippase GtrA